MTYEQIEKEFDEKFCLGVDRETRMPRELYIREEYVSDVTPIKSFLKQSFIKYLKSDVERWEKVFDYHDDMSNERHSTMRNVARTEIKNLQAQIKELEIRV